MFCFMCREQGSNSWRALIFVYHGDIDRLENVRIVVKIVRLHTVIFFFNIIVSVFLIIVTIMSNLTAYSN